MATIFTEIENAVFDQATQLHRTQAFVVGVDEEEHPGLYQCQVLPDLLQIENESECPWYPHIRGHLKTPLREGDLVWMQVSKDLAVGFVTGKANSIADQEEEQQQLWERLKEGLAELDEGESERENPVDNEINYENAFYMELFPHVYILFDIESHLLGFIDTERHAGVLYQDNVLYIRKENVEIHTDFILKGDEHRIVGDIEQEGNTHIEGELKVKGGESPVARANEALDIIDEIEEHLHVAPTGPTEQPLARDMSPLSAQLVQLKQTLSSTTTEVD